MKKLSKHLINVAAAAIALSALLSLSSLYLVERYEYPSARIYHLMVGEPASGLVMVFGGNTKHGWKTDLADSWQYNPGKNLWKKRGDVEAGQVFAAAYDSESQRVIMLNMKGETWAYVPKTDSWERMNPPIAPSGRCGHRLAYDSESDRVILFGGFKCTSVSDPHYSDSWSYDYNADRWTQTGQDNAPPTRIYHGMVYDSKSDLVIVWGGRVEDDSVWAFDLNRDKWTNLGNENGPKGIRAYHTLSYDENTNQIVVFGGLQLDAPMSFGGSLTGETWIYDPGANSWEHVRPDPDPAPSKRSHHAMVFDRKTGKHILFGGELISPYSDSLSSETWLFNAQSRQWTKAPGEH